MNRPQRLILAADGDIQAVDYPINVTMPRYNDVPIMRVGEFTPRGWYLDDGVFKPDAAYLGDLANNYDPMFHIATVNTDHSILYEYLPGAALGGILSLSVKGSGDDAVLVGDLINVDRQLAAEIDEGKWPTRSGEWFDAYDDFEWYKHMLEYWGMDPSKAGSVEEFFFYGKYDRYLRGLGMLGLNMPAVPGLGPMPGRAQAPDDMHREMPVAARLLVPRAACSEKERSLRVKSLTPYTTEDDMAEKKTAGDSGATEKVITGTADAQLKAANERIAELEASGKADREAKETAEKVASDGETTTAEALKTAQRAEARVAATQRDDMVKSSAADHTRNGKMAGENRDRFVELAIQLHDLDPREITAADGSTRKAEKSPFTLLNEFIANQPAVASIGSIADEPPADQSDSSGSNPAASAASAAIREKTAANEAEKKTGGNA